MNVSVAKPLITACVDLMRSDAKTGGSVDFIAHRDRYAQLHTTLFVELISNEYMIRTDNRLMVRRADPSLFIPHTDQPSFFVVRCFAAKDTSTVHVIGAGMQAWEVIPNNRSGLRLAKVAAAVAKTQLIQAGRDIATRALAEVMQRLSINMQAYVLDTTDPIKRDAIVAAMTTYGSELTMDHVALACAVANLDLRAFIADALAL